MSQFNTSGTKGYVATAAVGEGIIVKLSSGQAVVATAATDKFIGVTMNKAAAGETASIRLRSSQGTIKVKAGGTIAVGDKLTTNGSGQAIATVTAGNEILGMALEAGASGDMVEVMQMNDRV
jgi:hypothetical protein